MYLLRFLVFIYLGACDAADFNQAYAASVVANVEQLVTVPWTRVNNILFSAFNSRWSYLYTGDDIDDPVGPDGYVQYVNTNNTVRFLWSIFKPFEYEAASSIDMIYFGFENGKFLGYTNPSPGKLHFMNDGNSSCPEYNVTERCREFYGGNATDPKTGQKATKMTNYKIYDPRWRPWYTGSMASGSVWTDPYIFAEYEVLGITAAQQIITDSGQVIGVIGTDYTLGSIETVLGNLVSGYEDIFIFVVDNLGNLIAASIKGIGVDENDNQIPAVNSTYSRISTISLLIEKDKEAGGLGGWVSANGTIMTVEIEGEGLYWAQSTELRDAYGLHWHVVVVDAIFCEAGYYVLNKEQVFYNSQDEENERVVCGICPTGAECVGGNKLPFPKKGYWSNLDTSGVKTSTIKCARKTCQGFRNSMHSDHHNIEHNYEKMLKFCFTINSYKLVNSSYCDVDQLSCSSGSTGPLCGSCKHGWRYTSLTRSCIKCDANPLLSYITLIVVLLICILLAFLSYYRKRIQFPTYIWRSWIIMMTRHLFKTGSLKVVISTYQIIQSITYSMEISYPKLFSKSLRLLNFLALEFPGLECSGIGVYDRIYVSSCAPIVVAIIVLVVGKVRIILVNIEYLELVERSQAINSELSVSGANDNEENQEDENMVQYLKKKNILLLNKRCNLIKSQHAWALLFLSYLVLPPIAGRQLKAFDCMKLSFKNRQDLYVLKSDTSVNCASDSHLTFQIVNGLFVFLYLSIPIFWLFLLWNKKDHLFPVGIKEDIIIIQRRKLEDSLLELKFLYERYRPSMFFFESVDVFRRIIFIGIIPLMSASSLIRSAIGVVISLLFMIVNRELMPYANIDTNVVNYIADLVIYLVFASSLMIETGLNHGVDNVLFGIILVMVNFSVLGIGISGAFLRTKLDREEVFKQKSKYITKVEYACKYSAIQFQNVFEVINQNEIPPSHCLMFYYGSLNEVNQMLHHGIPVNRYRPGIIFTVLHPFQLTHIEKRYFANSEAFVICSLPQRLLQLLPGEDDAVNGKSSLWLLPNGVLRSMRGMHFDDLVDPFPWEQGKLLLPPHCIKRAFQFMEDISSPSPSTPSPLTRQQIAKKNSIWSNNPCSALLAKFHKNKIRPVATAVTSNSSPSSTFDTASTSSSSSSEGSGARRRLEGMEDANNELLSPTPVVFPLKFTVISDFLSSMIDIHKHCSETNLIPIYHYTDYHSAELIAKAGLMMNHKTDIGDAGVHFTVLGPISYNLGSLNYETNIILDFYGEEELNKYLGYNKFEICLVYGIDPHILEMTASGKGNLVHIPQKYFTDFSMPHPNGKYFLHPHRLIGAFRFDALGKFSGLSKYRDDLKLQHFQSLEILNKVHDILDEKDRTVTLIKTMMDEIAPSMKVTWAVTFSAEKFQNIFTKLELNSIPSTHVLVYHYGSLAEIEKYVAYGIPVKKNVGNGNIIFSMHQPDALNIEEVKIFGGSCEAFIVCSLPRDALLSLNTGRPRSSSRSSSFSHDSSSGIGGINRYGKSSSSNEKKNKKSRKSSGSRRSSGRKSVGSEPSTTLSHLHESKLFYLPSSILRAMRSKYYKNVENPEPWKKGALLLPPHSFQQAFQITDDEHIVKKQTPNITRVNYVFDKEEYDPSGGVSTSTPSTATSTYSSTPISHFSSPTPIMNQTPITTVTSVTKISLYYQYMKMMEKHKNFCMKNGGGLRLVYYYTSAEEAVSILKDGLMMKNGQFGMFSSGGSSRNVTTSNGSGSNGKRNSSRAKMIIGGGVRFSLKEPLSFGLWSKTPLVQTPASNSPFFNPLFSQTNKGSDGGGDIDVGSPGKPITYEENIINGFLGENNTELTKEASKYKVNVCIIYAVNPSILKPVQQMPNLVYIPKEYFQEFSLPSREGRYFLRPDYIMGAYTFHDKIPHDMEEKVTLSGASMHSKPNNESSNEEEDMLKDITLAAAAVAAKAKAKAAASHIASTEGGDGGESVTTETSFESNSTYESRQQSLSPQMKPRNPSKYSQLNKGNEHKNDDDEKLFHLRLSRMSTDSEKESIDCGSEVRISDVPSETSSVPSDTSDVPSDTSSGRTSETELGESSRLAEAEALAELRLNSLQESQMTTNEIQSLASSTSSSTSIRSSSPSLPKPTKMSKSSSLEELGLTQEVGSFELFDKELLRRTDSF